MDDLELIRDISDMLTQVNDQWNRYTCNESVDITFVPTMHYNTIKTADYLNENLMYGKFKEYIQDNFRQYGPEKLTVILSNFLCALNRNNELYSIKKDRFKVYVQHFSKRAQDIRVKGLCEEYYTKEELLEMGLDGDWYEVLNDKCNCYLQFLKPYLVDQEQNKPQPEKVVTRNTKLFKDKRLEQLYNGLVTGGFIPESTDKKHFDYVFGGGGKPEGYNGLKWCKNERLCVYMVSELFTDGITDWSVAREFKIKNPAQQKVGYENNKKTSKPRNFKHIDNILKGAGLLV